MPSADGLDAVTVDGFGTLLALRDPVPALSAALGRLGVSPGADAVRAAFFAEARYYRPRSLAGRDAESLASLRRECVGVFLGELDLDIPPESFVEAFVESIGFHPTDGATGALDRLAAAGLALACVANWDVSLHEHLRRLGIAHYFAVVLPSAEATFEKPDPRIFRLALERLGVPARRALHIGDSDVDRQGAASAGMAFEPVPLATLPERLGL